MTGQDAATSPVLGPWTVDREQRLRKHGRQTERACESSGGSYDRDWAVIRDIEH